jgi:glycosyltransferase involved in cell wall biosynthesis
MMSKPFFSIAIPTYEFNGKGVEYLNNSLKILSSQTFINFEVIISDHSNNNLIEQLVSEWSSVLNIKHFYFTKGKHKTHSLNVNNSINHCQGEWVKILFQDDFLFDSESLEKQFNFIKNTSDLKWFFTKFYHTFDGVNLYNLYHPKWNDEVYKGYNTLGGPSGLTVKNEEIPLFDERLIWLMDCDFYKKLFIKYGEPKICDEITVVNRTSQDQLTNTISESIKINEHKLIEEIYG